MAGINVFLVLISGIVISLIVGVAAGNIAVTEMFKVVGDGVTSMYDITVISILVACIVSLVKEAGGIQFILDLIKSRIRGKKGAELGILLLLKNQQLLLYFPGHNAPDRFFSSHHKRSLS